jgi:hypothetical protein
MDPRLLACAATGFAMMSALAFACGSSDVAPLGGPYGGTAIVSSPSNKPSRRLGAANACSSAADSGGSAPSDAGGGPVMWTRIYENYLLGCADRGCHIEMSTARGAYTWLQGQGYIAGANSNLVDPVKSCLKWYGGNMPPCGGNSGQAVADMDAWAAAGALNN